MKAMVPSAAVPVGRRRLLLEGIPGFRGVPATVLAELAAGLHEEHFPLGAIIVEDGEHGDRLFVIDDGEVEISTPGITSAISLGVLGPGDLFGEWALWLPAYRREATATALSPVTTLSVSADELDYVLQVLPQAREELVTLSRALLTEKFLRQHAWRT